MSSDEYRRPPVEPKRVTPEYMRRGMKPTQAPGRSLLHDSSGLSKVPQRKAERIPPPPEIDATPVFVKARDLGEPTRRTAIGVKRGLNSFAGEVPEPAPPVQIGNHEETMWFDDQRVATHPDARSVVGPSMEELQAQRANELRRTGSVRVVSTVDDARPAEPEEIREEQTSLNPGEYGIYCRGELIAKRFSSEEVRSVVATMVAENIELSEISVYQRIPLKFGILLE